MSVALTLGSSVEYGAGIVSQLLGLAAMAGILGATAALAYRSAADELIPRWLAVLAGASGVAVYLGAAPALETVVGEGVEPSQVEAAVFNVAALLSGAGGALLGRPVGDRYGTEVFRWSPTQDAGEDVSRLAQTVGQVTTVRLPLRIEDASGYDPIPDRTKESLEGKKLVFPRGLTVEELEERVRSQLRSDYGIGTVDLEWDDGGDLSYLAVGTRAAGIGSTLPPATNAVAVRADPGFSASTGDIVQVWDPEAMGRVLTGELRGVADDVVTIAVDAGDTPKVDPQRRYRLVTLPVEDRPDREFASLLRAAEETFSTVTVEAGSPLHGLPVGALALSVISIRPDDGDPVPFPDDEYRLAPGDLLFVIARPAGLRRLEAAAEPLDPAVVTPSLPTDETEPTESIQTGDSSGTDSEESTDDDGLPAAGAEEESTEGIVSGKADADSFKEIKAQFEETDVGADGPANEGPGDVTAESDSTAEAPGDSSDEAGGKSFDQLKAEFDSGDADWGDGAPPDEDSSPPGSESEAGEGVDAAEEAVTPFADEDETGGEDELMSLEEADITFDDESGEAGDGGDDAADDDDGDGELVDLDEADITFGDDGDEDEDALGGTDIDGNESEQSVSDDIGDLDFEDSSEDIDDLDLEADEGIFGEGGTEDADGGDEREAADEESEAEDGDDSEEEESEESGSGGGGGKSFAELKEEFESGDADWDEDVSDSPGGDMRLDE